MLTLLWWGLGLYFGMAGLVAVFGGLWTGLHGKVR